MSYTYHYTDNEANFGPPVQDEEKGGAHLTLDIITHIGSTIYALRRPNGLHDGPKNALYFPHGLIRYGEDLLQCVQRIVAEHSGATAIAAKTDDFLSWVEDDHWHMCLNVLAELEQPPKPDGEVSEVVKVTRTQIPEDFAWWTPEQAIETVAKLERRD